MIRSDWLCVSLIPRSQTAFMLLKEVGSVGLACMITYSPPIPPPPPHGSFTTTTNYASLSCQQRSIPADTGLLCRRKAKAKMADGSCLASGHTPPSLPILNIRRLGFFFFATALEKQRKPDTHCRLCRAPTRKSN